MSVSVSLTTDLNKRVALHDTITVPTTAAITGLSGLTLNVAFTSVGVDSFGVASNLTTQTLTGDQNISFNVLATNTNPPWGTVVDSLSVGVATNSGTYLSTTQSLTSVGIWPTLAEHSRLYVEGVI